MGSWRIFMSSMGIYGEVPGELYRSVLDPYRDSAAVIEASDLDYTILRSGWFTHDEAVDYQVTQKGEPFRGHDVSEYSRGLLPSLFRCGWWREGRPDEVAAESGPRRGHVVLSGPLTAFLRTATRGRSCGQMGCRGSGR